MRLQSDDELHRHSSTWLGPEGFTFPFAARYSAWGLWAGLTLLGELVAWALPVVPFNFFTAFYIPLIVMILTVWIMTRVNPDRPARTVIVDTLRAAAMMPAAAETPTATTFRTRRIRVHHDIRLDTDETT